MTELKDVATAQQDIILLNLAKERIKKEARDLQVTVDGWKQQLLEEVTFLKPTIMLELDVAKRDLTQFIGDAGDQRAQNDNTLLRTGKRKADITELEFTLKEKQTNAKLALRDARLLQYRHNYPGQFLIGE